MVALDSAEHPFTHLLLLSTNIFELPKEFYQHSPKDAIDWPEPSDSVLGILSTDDSILKLIGG